MSKKSCPLHVNLPNRFIRMDKTSWTYCTVINCILLNANSEFVNNFIWKNSLHIPIKGDFKNIFHFLFLTVQKIEIYQKKKKSQCSFLVSNISFNNSQALLNLSTRLIFLWYPLWLPGETRLSSPRSVDSNKNSQIILKNPQSWYLLYRITRVMTGRISVPRLS